MDWVEEKMEKIRIVIRNLPIKKALLAYLLLAALTALILSGATMRICEKWTDILIERQDTAPVIVYTTEGMYRIYEKNHAGLTDRDRKVQLLLEQVMYWCPYLYATVSSLIFGALFYRKRLKRPFGILEDAVDKIRQKELDFTISYESRDEMGRLCGSFEEMRKNLEENQKEMWNLVEEQKRLNAAFAHDLRTPLTVIRGYSDFLIRYLPKGAISQEKLKTTLKLLAEQAERLERFSGTMKTLRSVDEIPFAPERRKTSEIKSRIQGMADALNAAGEVEIRYRHEGTENELLLDEDLLMEVLDNLLSNAIRYADSRVELETKEEDGMLYLFVSDDGPGFSEDALKNASELYFSEGTKEEHFGIGLNLSAVLCKKHGGRLSFANRAWGKGAVVTASFALTKEI